MRRLLALTASVVLLTAALPSVPATAVAPTVVNVTQRTTNQAEEAVAVNRNDPTQVVIASNLASGYGIFVAHSSDGGATWAHTVLGNRDEFGLACCDPTVTWDKFGNVFLAWLGYAGHPAPTILTVVWSQDGGATWSLFEKLDPPAPATRTRTLSSFQPVRSDSADRGGGIDQPTIASGPKGLWAIWFQSGRLQAAGAKVRGLGAAGSFRAVQDLPGTRGCTFGDLSVGPGGAVAQVCQRDIAGTKPRRSTIRFSTDPDGFGPAGFTKTRLLARTNVSLFEPIPAQRHRTIDAEAGLAWDTLGTSLYHGWMYLVFADEQPDQSNDTSIWLRTSVDGGATWGPRTEVESAANSQFLQRISLDPTTGHLALSFHDCRLDTGALDAYDTNGTPNDDAMYFMTFSADGGATWSASTAISEGASNAADANNGVDFGDYSGLGFAGGFAYPAWADNSNSTGDNPNLALHAFDVYTAQVPEF